MDLSIIATYFDDIAKIVGGILVVGGAAWSIWKFFWPMLKSVRRSFVQMEKIAEVTDIVLAEFRPNGGNSMKDSITRIEANVDNTRTDISQVRNDAVKMEARMWAIVASLPDPVFETNATGEYVRVNMAYQYLTGRPAQELMGNGWEIVIHPDDRSRVWQEWHDAVTRVRTFESAYRVVDFDGSTYTVRCIAHPYKNPQDETVLGYLGRMVDVKELAPTPKTK